MINKNNIPRHIAIILDGNGRWAQSRNKPRTYGHLRGARTLGRVAVECNKLGVEVLTVYAFSTENWKRPTDEVNFLMKTPVVRFSKAKKKIKESNIKVKFIGRRSKFPNDLLEAIEGIEKLTENHTGLLLQVCADYGSRYELTEAVKQIAVDIKDNKLEPSEITEKTIESHLMTFGTPELDLLVRTSGEHRISNFLLWQLSYSELYFTDVHWPDFDKNELEKAIYSFQNRKRRYGGLKKEENHDKN